jgi:membrane protein
MLLTSAIAALHAHEARLGAVGEYVRVLGSVLPLLVSAGLAALTFFLLYRFLPGTRVSSRAALVAALPAALLWLLSRSVFSVLVAGSSRYGQLYGPLAGAVVLLLWIYYSAYIMVFCAELGAAAQQRYWPKEGARPEGSI